MYVLCFEQVSIIYSCLRSSGLPFSDFSPCTGSYRIRENRKRWNNRLLVFSSLRQASEANEGKISVMLIEDTSFFHSFVPLAGIGGKSELLHRSSVDVKQDAMGFETISPASVWKSGTKCSLSIFSYVEASFPPHYYGQTLWLAETLAQVRHRNMVFYPSLLCSSL